MFSDRVVVTKFGIIHAKFEVFIISNMSNTGAKQELKHLKHHS